MAEDLRPAKAALRRRVLALRAALPPAEAALRGAAAVAALLATPAWQQAGCVLLFWSMPGEVPTAGLAAAALAAGKTVALPRIVRPPAGRRYLELRAIPAAAGEGAGSIADRLVPGTWGILEPPATAPLLAPAAIDLAVVPGVAFDRCGRRLGYGGGFYDALLPRLRPDALTLGLCFGLQVVEAVPAGPEDVPVAGIVSEDGVVYLTGK